MTRKLTKGLGFLIITILMMTLLTSSALVLNYGWKDANSYYDNNGVQNPHRAYSQNDQYAIFNNDNNSVFYGFGNNLVPSGAVINGIELRFDAYRNKESERTLSFQLYNGNTALGNLVHGGAISTDDTDTYSVLGSMTDNWGYGFWDSTKINNLRVKVSVSDGHSNNYLDHIQIKVHYDFEEFDISYNLDGGVNDINNPSTYNISTPTIVLANATKLGYSFDGWFAESNFINKVESIPTGSTGDINLYAKWVEDIVEPDIYDITYILNGGLNDIDNPSQYNIEDSDIILKVATRSGYLFAGWFDNEEFTGSAITTIDTASAMDYTLYAKWIEDGTDPLEVYNIIYFLNGGTNHVSNPATYQETDADITLLAPTRAGYTFSGWFTSSEFINQITSIPMGSTGDIALYAKWIKDVIELDVYDITYILNGGVNNLNNPSQYDIEDSDIVLKAATRSGYLFAGWYGNSDFTGSAITTIDTANEMDYILYAKWIKDGTDLLEVYNINYILNGGTNNPGNPLTFQETDEDITLLKPTRTGYVFAGWYANSVFTGSAVTKIITSSATDQTLYAKWTAVPTTPLATGILPQTGQYILLFGGLGVLAVGAIWLTYLNKQD